MSQLLQVATRILASNGGISVVDALTPPDYVDQGIPYDFSVELPTLSYIENVLPPVYSAQAINDGASLIIGDSTGQNLLVNTTHALSNPPTYRYSSDGGVTWNGSANLPYGAAGALSYSCNYDEASDTWYVSGYAGNPYWEQKIFASTDGGATWGTSQILPNGSLARSVAFGLGANGDLYVTDNNTKTLRRYEGLPGSTAYTSVSLAGLGLDAIIQGWHILQISPTRLFAFSAGGDPPPYDGFLVDNDLTNLVGLPNKFARVNHWATNGVGTAICLRSPLPEGATATTSVYDIVEEDTPASGLPLDTMSLDWVTAVKNVECCWSEALGGFLIVAQDATTPTTLRIKFSQGADFSQWYALPPLTLSYTPNDYSSRQIYWSHGGIYYYGYCSGGGNGAGVLERITIA